MPPDLTAWAKPLQAWWHAHPVGVQWPVLLWLLLAVPLLAWWLRRPRPGVRAWGATVSASDAALTAPRRLIASQGLMLGGLAALLLAASAPYVTLTIPILRQEVMLVLDMSGSMRAADIAPDRFTAARNAAKEFVAGMPRHTRVGIVAVAGTALVVQQLTDDRQQLDKALDQLQLQRGTAIGSGIVVALAALLPDAKIDTNLHITGQPTMPGWLAGRLGAAPEEKKEPPNRQEPGANGSTAIVLVSDGMSNIGPDPLKMAQLAADHGVRLYTIGVGTLKGAKVSSEGWSMQVRLEEEGLKKLATVTAGEYFRGASSAELNKVYESLKLRLQAGRREKVEIASLLAVLGGVLVVASALLSLARTGRVV